MLLVFKKIGLCGTSAQCCPWIPYDYTIMPDKRIPGENFMDLILWYIQIRLTLLLNCLERSKKNENWIWLTLTQNLFSFSGKVDITLICTWSLKNRVVKTNSVSLVVNLNIKLKFEWTEPSIVLCQRWTTRIRLFLLTDSSIDIFLCITWPLDTA